MCYVELFLSYCQTLKIINMSNLREKAEKYAQALWSDCFDATPEHIQNGVVFGYELCQKEYEEKLCWIPIDKLENPTIPFLGKDKFGKIELFKVANVFYLKAMDIVEWRSIL